MIIKEDIRKALDRYFNSVEKEQFMQDLTQAGFTVCERVTGFEVIKATYTFSTKYFMPKDINEQDYAIGEVA
ncbi:MAG: hypothetical protein KGZ75_13715 [Syntrophomonadaceae bacterium]|nr:hypothetical protein [Syntrophomonadaceae bacterium]